MSYEVTEETAFNGDDLMSMGQFNMTQPLEDMKLDKNMVWLLVSLLSSIVWMVYITFYNSRLFGCIITKLANRLYVRGAYFKIGSLNVNPLAGKIMFRDVVYVCFDYTVRVQDGYFIFRWWRSYVPKDVSEDLSHSDTRLSVMLNGFEVHIYNRSDLYARLEKTFGLKPSVLVPTEDMNAEEIEKFKEQIMNDENQRHISEASAKIKKPRPEAMTATTWRDLIPVIKIDICSGRFAFGNRLTPTTLSLCVEEAHCVYSTKPAVSKLDHFMHFVKAKVENAKVLLAPSPKFTGMVDEPPRYMGEGFVVMMSNLMELYFYMDEAGIVPEEPVTLTLANGDVVEAAPPVWGIDIKCGKGTDFSYGPWADRQRDHLFKFFFPPDYQPMSVTKPPKPGDRREVRSFDISLCTLNEATIDVLFSKNKETNAVHVNIGAGSYLEVTLPWIILQDGMATKVTGQLLHVEATTSLQYRSLAECETLQFNVKVHYPIKWNDHQEWTINLTGSKATAYIVFSHKEFFQDLIEDWASKARPDILSFVPYTWKFGVILKEFEILTLSNEFNWIDCSSTNQENHHLAFCGDLFDLSFSLPFDDFLPVKLPIVFWIHGEGLDLSMYIPEISSSRPILLALDENARILTRDGNVKKRSELINKKWRRVCQRAIGWIDCWTVPIVALSIKYIYHPMPPLGPDPQADITTPEKEEILLSPMRIPKMRKSPAIAWTTVGEGGAPRFDPTSLPPDQVSVELEIGSSVMLAYGAILRNFIHLKENIFGEDQSFTDMENSNSKNASRSNPLASGLGKSSGSTKDDPSKSLSETSLNPDDKPKRFDPRLYRPLEVIVSVTIHDLQAHVMKNCNENDPPCPIVLIERLGFEMKKRFYETELQVLVSPSFLISSDNTMRPGKDKHLRQGHLLLSAVQVRGHAMFSNEGRQLEEETLEYAWLLEVQLGKLSGKMTLSQLCNVVTGLETLVFLTMDSENELKSPKTVRYCHHGVPSSSCPHTKEDAKYRCPSTEDIKYRMTRVAVDAVDLYLIENGTAMHTWISPIRMATCNLHGQQVKSGITGLIPTILLRQFVSTGGHFSQYSSGNSHSNTNTTGSSRSAKLHHQNSTKHVSEDGYRKTSDETGPIYRRTTVDDGGPMISSTGSGSSAGVLKSGRRDNAVEPPYPQHRKDSKEHRDDPYGSISSRKGRDRSDDPSIHYRRDKEDPYASLHSARNSGRDIDSNEPWLEVGCVSLGPIILEAASALPIPEHCLHLVQHSYLKVHDEKNKKLWFLWSSSTDPVRCGCVGGCAFFGTNRNGPRFFKPCAQDIQEFINIARYHIHPNPREYGFGQSLLHEGQLVFHTPPYSLQPVSLQECYEYIGKPNLHRSGHRHPPAHGGGAPSACCGTTLDSKSPHLPQKHEAMLAQKTTSAEISPSNTLIRGGSGVVSTGSGTTAMAGAGPGERSGKSSLERVKEKDVGSPLGSDRARGRRFSYTSGRQSTIPHDVPYCRLLDSSPKTTTNSSKVSTPTPGRIDGTESRLLTPKGFKVLQSQASKSYASDSRLTVDNYLQGEIDGPFVAEDHQTLQSAVHLHHHHQHHQHYQGQHHHSQYHNQQQQQHHHQMMLEMSHSAPSPGHPLASDSEQSLGGILPTGSTIRPMPSDDVIMRDVQRTVSLTSENPSEAFFSADEDLHASRSSSLKAGVVDHHPHPVAIQKKRFASDLSIVGPNELEGRLSTHRSDYEIHTPEHRSLPMRPQSTAELNEEERRLHGLATPMRKFSNISPRPEFRHFKPVYDVDPQDSSESHSLSSSSFISALSSQEDITLVNLHMQINRPIVDSPLLMASYVTHLAQVRCSNWSHCSMPLGADAFSMPLFQQNEDGGLVYIGGKLIPHFDTYANCREVKIVSRYDVPSAGSGVSSNLSGAGAGGFSTLPKPHPWDPSVLVRSSFDKQENKEGENEFLSSQGEIATRNSIVVRFKGQVDVMLTPLLLEGLQRMIESLTPTLATLHPLTVVNDIHASCVTKVQAVNILKRDQSLSYWSQVHSNSKRSTAERNLQGPGGPVLTDVYEESISTQVQGLIVLPKINVTLIQSSVVEEVISFAALDNVQELSCASLLAVCFEGVSTRFHLGKTTKASMHTVYTQPTVRSGGLKKSGLIRGTRALLAHLSSQTRPDNVPGEPILLETSEKQLEELIITLDIGKAHAQLRRLKNESANLPDSQIVITAIPSHRSRAMFDCTRMPDDSSTATLEGSSSSGLGFIMFEGGLEGVSVKIVKRSQFEKSENAEETLKPEPETIATATVHSDANQNSITLNNPLNLVTLLNEAGGNMAAEALAKFGMKKPGTPKSAGGSAKDRSSLFDIKSKDKIITTTTTTTTTTATIIGDGGKTFKTNIVPDEVDAMRGSFISDGTLPTTVGHPPVQPTAGSSIQGGVQGTNNGPGAGPATNVGQQHSATAANGSNADPMSSKAGGGCTTAAGTVAPCSNDNGKTSSCVIDFKTVWFNFAAPPRTPITRKIDYTRLDWNLLSTASPAITAWMNPCNRFAIKVVALMKAMYIRRTAVTVALMADAWERPSLHRPVKSRYGGKFTPLAKTLQEDPSCQLCTVLQKFVLDETAAKIECILKQQYLPQLSIMRQAVIVLSRQWKNVLYNPMLFEHQYKGKLAKPVNVTFALPQDEDAEDTDDIDTDNYPVGVRENHPLLGEENEHTMLLGQCIQQQQQQRQQSAASATSTVPTQHTGGQQHASLHVIKMPEEPPVPSAAAVHMTAAKLGDSLNTSPSTTNNSHNKLRKKSSVKSFIPPAAPPSRASIQMFPIIFDKQDPVGVEYGELREGSAPSVCSSSDSMDKPWTPPANHKEDLYSWMAKQQSESTKQREKEKTTQNSRPTSQNRPAIHSVKYMQDNNRILDAHLIFEPMLTCLGVMPQQMINNVSNKDVSSLESLGTNLSLVCSFDTIRIDIVVSEAGDSKKPPKQKDPKKRGNGKFTIIMPGEQPAFLCEQVGVELEVRKMTDGFPDDTKPAMLYVSRGQLKKHTSTVINFSLNVRYISQQVNMPLLRLLHQITNMYQNVKDAQNELREAHPENGGKRSVPLKDESSLASEINDPTLMGSLNEPLMAHIETSGIFDYTDERYDKFNEDISTMRHELRHSISRSKMPTLGPLIPLTPSPNSRNRPHSFAQKLRSTSKTVKGKLGYTNLNETINTPIKMSPTTGGFSFADAQSKQSLEAKNSLTGAPSSTFGDYTAPFDRSTFTGPIHSILDTPKCWKTVYHLLAIYSAMPETKTITHRVSISPDAVEQIKARKYNLLHESKNLRDEEELVGGHGTTGGNGTVKDVGVITQERTRLVVFGVAKIHRTRLLASLSGLKLEAEITALHSSTTWRKKSRPASLECSLTGQVGRAMIVLLEGAHPNQQTVVKVSIGKSQTLYSSITRRGKDKNNGLLSIGIVNVDIPQHPVALHGMMTRSSKQISSTLQELRVTRTSARLTRQNEEPESPLHHHQRDARDKATPSAASNQRKHSTATVRTMTGATTAAGNNPSGLLQPLVMQFNIILQSLSISAALLPSLQAQYKMDHVTSTGVTGSKAKFTVDLPNHSLSFTTKIQTTETNLPSEACIALPPVHVSAEYVSESTTEEVPIDGVVLRQGGYLAASAEIGVFERCLTTDLLNHLVFVQKVFMKEVNEVVQKVYGGEKPVPLWLEESEDNGNTIKRILFSLNIRVKRIQLTATTPCSSAVRFETGQLELHLSNRVKNIADASNTKLFGKAQIDLNLSLGQIIKNIIFDEAEPEFQQHAFFNTTIGLRNAFQNEMLNDDKELVLITLKRPLIYVQPIAVDKAILVWLNYKNAYEYWTEKRANLNKEVLMATQQVLEKVPFGQISHHLATTANLSTLFLQLTVEDMGICLPLNQPPQIWGNRSVQDFEQKGAVVITLENTIISACSSGSLVSKGRFAGLCLRFAEDFDSSLDEWKPNMNDASIMNLCVVSEGTYEVCSRTIAAKHPENAKWFLNVKWQMEGVDIHLDVNIGKQLSALGHTLTMLTGSEDDEPISSDTPDSDDIDASGHQSGKDSKSRKSVDSLPSFLFDTTLDPKKRSLLMENEINEQTKIVNDFRTLGASAKTIENEERRLQELQAVYYKYFRRDMIQKWKRPAMRKPMLKAANRSRSFVAPSPTREDLIDAGCIDGVSGHTGTSVGCGASSVMDAFTGSEDMSSLQESPNSGPSRTASLRVKIPPNSSRVTFSETMRQSSLPSADSDVAAYSDSGLDWPRYDSSSVTSDVPHLLEIDGEQVELRKKSPSHPQKQQEPNIDFELDIKVLVNSGKCVLHTKDIHDERLSSAMPGGNNSNSNNANAAMAGNNSASMAGKHHKRERSTGGATDWGSPIPPRRNKDKSRLKYNTTPYTALVDLTIFHIPGLDVKLQYQSKTVGGDDASPRLSTTDPFGVSRKLASKRATLFAWMTLQSIPEETIISPHILEFLEQTLEPIPSSKGTGGVSGMGGGHGTNNTNGVNGAGVATSGGGVSNPVNLQMLEHNYAAVYASFPVDVVVYFHMQPSTFRFSCLPVSRVECMLQLPSLDIIFSSNRQDDDSSAAHTSSQTGESTAVPGGDGRVAGGLSVTGCLADFNVYIFHPYGGKKSNLKEAHQFSPLADSERKDSLSINVEFVKFHITRSKKINIVETSMTSRKHSDQASKATIRFSTIVDIGSASFKYDMRRLTEILAFPKAWYRRSIVRRMFLGDLGMQQTSMCDLEIPIIPEGSVDGHSMGRAGERDALDMESRLGGRGESMNRERLRLSLENIGMGTTGGSGGSSASSTARIKDQKSSSLDSTSSPSDVNQVTSWETLVLFAINFTKLNVQMNMGNVMGNIVWLTKAFRSDGRLSIGSTGHKNMYIGVGLGGSSLDAKGGIVGGTIDLNRIDTYIHIREDPGSEPDHKVGIKLMALELKFDYMGTSVLMTRVSSLNAQLRDEWKFSKDHDFGNKLPTNYPAIILIHGDLSWDQLQMMISKSTTADILKMFYKLEEFFSQQFKSSKRVFSSLEPRLANSSLRTSVRRREEKKSLGADASIHDARHHRHWQRPLKQTKGLWLSTLGVPLSNIGTVLGGTMELHGQNISLACFHGINFKAKSWALFSLKEPCIDFATEAQHVESTEEVHIIQTLTFGLGMNSQQPPQHHSNATVVRMSRNVIFPPQFKTLHEWFHYAFANSEIDGVDRFPVIERDKEHNTNSIERARGSGSGSASHQKLQDPNHNREVIFALPSLQLHFKTEHLQGISTPDTAQDKPMVECSFITAFEDHIFVTVDADAFFFLHDLITSYLSEKEKVLGTITNNRSSSPNPVNVTPPPPASGTPAGLSVLKSGHTLKSSTSNLMSAAAPSMSSLGTQDSTSSQSIANGGGSSVELNEVGSSQVGGTGPGATMMGTKQTPRSVDDPKKPIASTVSSPASASSGVSGTAAKHVNIVVEKSDLESFMRTDWRHFNCKTWHLEPTVRLLSWAGKSIEPYGIDYILNKLGFSHARTTIPKWLQRGFMDPLDKVEALLMLQLLLMVKDNGTSDEKDSSK
ncbi:bridge-like lipid transfer protein family member 1 [Anopheles marshallii]|uniref:bridge-like lipid transfer protein family member 1 n=1 Tax=Anopheles marshallii TaxID=1521116 RepID=UPI00237C1815|nr:bridge-like lipid transfer protein family member 1 [Anopheles marshallii]